MIIPSKTLGNVQIDKQDIYTFVRPILGFEQYKYFVILEHNKKQIPFNWLQSVETPDLCFIIIQPAVFIPDYKPKVHHSMIKPLDIQHQSDILLYSIVVVPDDVTEMTANLKSPLIFNIRNKTAMQVVLDDDRYSFRHYIMKGLNRSHQKENKVCSY